MADSFSIRQGIIPKPSLKKSDIPLTLQNRLWNKIETYFSEFPLYNNVRSSYIEFLWDSFFKEDLGMLNRRPNRMTGGYDISFDQLKIKFYRLEWYRVYDFIELIIRYPISETKTITFIDQINTIFSDEGMELKIISGLVTPLLSELETQEIAKAVATKYDEVNKHLQEAIKLYSDRPNPSYLNSIKESISAVETLARVVLNKPDGTLGKMSQQLNIHSSLKNGIKEFYDWTSDEDGIRHGSGGKKFPTGEADAKFMLVQCSALVNYIIAKYE